MRNPAADECEITYDTLHNIPRLDMINPDTISASHREKDSPTGTRRIMTVARCASKLLMLVALALMAYGVVWNFATRLYLRGFADAIIPLSGSPQEKTEALVVWFHHEPQRKDLSPSEPHGLLHDRDPVKIVQDSHLLKVCGTASNAFMNLADASDLKVRRLLLLDRSGNTMHVVAEVQWGTRWIVLDPAHGAVFKDHLGRALTKEELRNPEVYQDAVSRMPGYNPAYTFERTVHLRLKKIPVLGGSLRSVLDRLAPGWEEAVNWSYLPENPALWFMVISFLLLLFGILGHLIATRYSRDRRGTKMMESHP